MARNTSSSSSPGFWSLFTRIFCRKASYLLPPCTKASSRPSGADVESLIARSEEYSEIPELKMSQEVMMGRNIINNEVVWEWALLVSPFFFWGTAMVAMKQVLPKTGPFFVSAFRLIPAGLILVCFAASRGRKFPSGIAAWLSIAVFALVDAACFQGFLAQGLERTSAGLGSVIIDSQPLTVSILAALLFGESIGFIGAAGLVLGVIGLLLLEFSFGGSGEWWMLLAAQCMAVGTVMVRWVSKYCDPIMATGWHMVIGGLPLVAISLLNHDPALNGSFVELTSTDLLALLYTSVFGSAISYGVYFYNATRGSLTKLSSLTFLTPMFASIFGEQGKKFVLLASFADLERHPEVEETVEDEDDDHQNAVEALDLKTVKKLVLSFERRLKENIAARLKYPDQPEKFADSEVELHDEIQKLKVLAGGPEFYPELVNLGTVASITSLLNHDNTDIAIDVVALLQDLTDEDVLEDNDEPAQVLVDALIENNALELLVQNLSRLSDADPMSQQRYTTL
nr:WAT1-related protein At3g02690, chloroplastic-like [Ipomoea batatas]